MLKRCQVVLVEGRREKGRGREEGLGREEGMGLNYLGLSLFRK
jgi:hypothetical protein